MNEIDRIFKNKLNNHHSGIPEGIWDNIESALDKQQHRVWSNLPWSVAAVIAVIIVSVGSFWIQDLNSYTEIGNVLHQTSETHPVTTNKNNRLSSDLHNQDNSTADSFTGIESDLYAGTSAKISDITHIEVSKTDVVQPIVIRPGHISKEKDASATDFTNKSLNQVIPADMNSFSTSLFQPLMVNIETLNDNLMVNAIRSNLNQVVKGLKMPTEPFKACPFNVDYRDKSLDIYYSSDYIDKKLSDQSGDATLKDMRLATESPMYSFSAGLRLGYNVGYRWNLHTGINYSQINEKFEYTDPESSKVRIVIIKDYIYEDGKVVDSIVKQEEVLVPGSTELTVYNKFRTIDIPLLARYTIMANRHLSLSAIGGISINVASYEKGMIISDETLKPVHISKSEDDGNVVYKNQLGVSYYGSLSLAYHLTDNMDVLVEPYARLRPSSVTLSTYPLYQKFNTYGMNLGVRYKF